MVKNHRKFIRGCLETLRWADEVLILNDGSTDGALDLARQFPNVRVFDHPLGNNWSRQRNVGLDQAGGDWVFQVDVDHRISRELAAEIQAAVRDPHKAGFHANIWSVVMGAIFPDAGAQDLWPALVRRKGGRWTEINQTHAHMEFYGPAGHLREPIIHLGPHPGSIMEFFTKNSFFAETEALTNVNSRVKIPPRSGLRAWWWFVLKPGLIFLRKYCRGYRRMGMAGFHFALLRAIGYYMVYLRTWEIEYVERGRNEMFEYCKKHNLPLFLD
jgi:glycosyltransferase involved in cell wall biosynthesis